MNWLSVEQSNSSMIIGDVAMLKLFRRIAVGPHPEAEMGRYLTEQGFANIAPLLGEVVRVDPNGDRHALAIAQGFIRNQGDAWTWTLDLLMRGLGELTADTAETQATETEQHEDYDSIATLLGQRLGEMHAILARDTGDPAFAPEGQRERSQRSGPSRPSSSLRLRSPHWMRRPNGTRRRHVTLPRCRRRAMRLPRACARLRRPAKARR